MMDTTKDKKDLLLLLVAAVILIFSMLQSGLLWTTESRWAAVCMQMLLRHDYLHPYIFNGPYYDKPLLSYWLILLVSKLTGGLTTWSLRLPEALSATLVIYLTYRLGELLCNRKAGILAGWFLLTSYFFIFWSRVAGTDMLNLAGIMLAVFWYYKHKDNPTFYSYFVFFLITTITSLCKGLLGLIIPLLIITPIILTEKQWKKYLNWKVLAAFIIAASIYLLPFILSKIIPDNTLAPNNTTGLFEVFHENVLRFFQPFDHKKPFYIYFIFLPAYTIPWCIFFIPALCRNWKAINTNQKWLLQSLIILFAFFTLSGSRRSYYILPLIPFAALFTASWLAQQEINKSKLTKLVAPITIITYLALFSWFVIARPIITNAKTNAMHQFVNTIKTAVAATHKNWNQYQILTLDGGDFRSVFYLQPTQPVNGMSSKDFQQAYNQKQYFSNTIIITNFENIKNVDFLSTDKKYIKILEADPSKHGSVAFVAK